MADLSDPKYQAMLDFITAFIDSHGYGPTVREMQAGLGLSSTAVVNYRMHILRREGRLDWEEGLNRTVRVVDHSTESLVLRLASDDTKRFREAFGRGDPKTLLMEAVRQNLRTKTRCSQTNSD